MKEQYKDLWISGHARAGYPGAYNSTPVASVSYQRANNSVVDLTKLDVQDFEFESRDVAELIGLELARLIVDTCYPELLRKREETERVIERQTPEIALSALIIQNNSDPRAQKNHHTGSLRSALASLFFRHRPAADESPSHRNLPPAQLLRSGSVESFSRGFANSVISREKHHRRVPMGRG